MMVPLQSFVCSETLLDRIGAASRKTVIFETIFTRAPAAANILALRLTARYAGAMPSVAEVEKLAFDLPDSERAVLAARLLGSLPPVLDDEDEGIAEALRRDAELDTDPRMGISLEQLDEQVRALRS